MKNLSKLMLGLIVIGLTVPFGSIYAAGTAAVDLRVSDETISVGDTLEVTISISPNNESLDTVRINTSFPSDLLQVDHFALGNLFPRSSPGNSIDNIKGVISEGGFSLTGPVTNSGTFGTIFFTAIKKGTASIKVLDTSRLIAGGEEKIDTSKLNISSVEIQEKENSEKPIVTIQSLSHPNQNQWSSINDVTFSWSSSGAINEYKMAFDQSSISDPAELVSGNSITIQGVTDGVWYLHLKGKLSDGTETEIVNYKVMIDATSPNAVYPVLDNEQVSEGQNIILTFGTTDEMSGIAKYEISINDGEFQEKESPVTLENLKPGNYFVEVKALDNAGNKIYGRTVARVYPAGVELPPVIPAEKVTTEEGKINKGALADNSGLIIGMGAGLVILLVGAVVLKKRRKLKK